MTDIIACPSCQRKLRVRPELLGQSVKCPSCGATFLPAGEPDRGPPAREAEDPPRQRPLVRRRAEEEDDDDDRLVRARSRRRYEEEDDDEDDDRPRRRRRRRGYDEHRGGLVLALGICAIIGVFTIVTGPMAWVMGSNDLREIREGRMDPEGESLTRVGWILGMIATILVLLFVVGFCLIFGIIAIAANS
jgi:uncharacterized Zn finger protein (UPF0148 family)